MTKDDLRKEFPISDRVLDDNSEFVLSYVEWLENKILDMHNNIDILLNKLDKS